MRRKVQTRLLYALGAFIAFIFLSSYLYMVGMQVFENEPIPYYVALQASIESLTTAGFGGHAPWESLEMNLLVVTMNLIGVSLFFFGIPIAIAPIVAPKIRDAIADSAPEDTTLSDHVILTGFDDTEEVLTEELEKYGKDYLFITEDEEKTIALDTNGYDVVFGNPEERAVLEAANIQLADSIVVAVSEDVNPSVLLAANKYDSHVNIVAVANRSEDTPYYKLAGADSVINSKQELGRSLAIRATRSLADQINEAVDDDAEIHFEHLVVREGGSYYGKKISEIGRELDGIIVGGWVGGSFTVDLPTDTVIEDNTILLVTSDEDVEKPRRSGKVIVVGRGNVGAAAIDFMEGSYDVTTVDENDPSVDVQGDITDPETLSEAGIEDARAIVISINDDNDAIYGALIANELSPETEIIARAQEKKNVWKLYDAGADYAMSLETLSGSELASEVIENTASIPPTDVIEVEQIGPGDHSGDSIATIDIDGYQSYLVIAVKRDGAYLTDVDGNTSIEDDDELLIVTSFTN